MWEGVVAGGLQCEFLYLVESRCRAIAIFPATHSLCRWNWMSKINRQRPIVSSRSNDRMPISSATASKMLRPPIRSRSPVEMRKTDKSLNFLLGLVSNECELAYASTHRSTWCEGQFSCVCRYQLTNNRWSRIRCWWLYQRTKDWGILNNNLFVSCYGMQHNLIKLFLFIVTIPILFRSRDSAFI